jgi:hypothetical protein
LAFEFWNWPPFIPEYWKIDIPAMVSEGLGHEVVTTLGHI